MTFGTQFFFLIHLQLTSFSIISPPHPSHQTKLNLFDGHSDLISALKRYKTVFRGFRQALIILACSQSLEIVGHVQEEYVFPSFSCQHD